MAFKKYTYKKGKKYGPYLYENKRVDGKIVTTYLGPVKQSNVLKGGNYSWIYFRVGFFLVLLLLFFAFGNLLSFTGRVSLELEESYIYGGQLDGTVRFGLKQGELIPKDSIVRVSAGDNIVEIGLGELTDKEIMVGSFYAENIELIGVGEGYGILGEKVFYPDVDFELRVYDSDNFIEKDEGNEEEFGEKDEEEFIENDSDSVDFGESRNETDGVVEEENLNEGEESEDSSDNSGDSEEDEEGEEEVIEESGLEDEIEGDEGDKVEKDDKKDKSEKNEDKSNNKDKKIDKNSEESGSQSSEEDQNSDSSESDSESDSEGSSDSASNVADSYVESITGSVILENEIIISGIVSKEEDFDYGLEENQKAEINSGSVKLGDKLLADEEIQISLGENKVTVSTEYYETEKGFGEEYSGKNNLILEINLSNFGINITGEILKVELNYEEVEIVSVEEKIKLEGVVVNETQIKLNESEIILNQTELDLNETSGNFSFVLDIPMQRMPVNSSILIVLSEHFEGAEKYEFVGDNFNASFENNLLNLSAIEGFRGAGRGKIIGYDNNFSLESNEFLILVSSGAVNIETARDEIVIGKPVRWIKNVSLEIAENVTIELDKSAENVSVRKIVEGVEENISVITGLVSVEIDLGERSGLMNFIRGIISGLTGRVVSEDVEEEVVEIVLDEDATEYVIEYYTEAPEAIEEVVSSGKRVVVSARDELNYTDVLAFTSIEEKFRIGEEESIRIYWNENRSYLNFDAYDLDGNEFLDYIEWIVPHLSNQTFEIILITKAEHLDSNRSYMGDIYEFVKDKDDIWSPEIPVKDYVRVVFERNLTSEKDITLFARSNYSNVSVEVYEVNGSDLIALFEEISDEGEYKVYLDGSSGFGLGDKIQDTFDLKISGVSGGVEFDWIVDPTVDDAGSVLSNVTTEEYPFSHITMNDSDKIFYFSYDVNSSSPYDYTSNNNNGTPAGDAHQDGTGLFGKGFRLDGNGDYAYVPHQEIMNTSNFTFMTWIYYHTIVTSDERVIFAQYEQAGAGEKNFIFWIDTSGRYGVHTRQSNCESFDISLAWAGSNPSVGQWYHIALRRNATAPVSVYELFIDGQPQTRRVGNNDGCSTGNAPLMIGARESDGPQEYNNATYDETIYYNRPLTYDEINDTFKNQSYRFKTPAIQLFENNSITTQDGTINRVNITTNSSLNFGTAIQLRLWEYDDNYVNTANTTWENITDGDNQVTTFNISTGSYNVSLEFDFVSDANNFYSPVLRDEIVVTDFAGPADVTNTAPTDPAPEVNSTDGSNKTAQDLHCFDTIIDPDGDRLNVTVLWYNNTNLEFTLYFNSSYANNTFFDGILDSGNTTKGDNWTCGMRLFDGSDYSNWVNASLNISILNTAPDVPSLSTPGDATNTTDRTPNFTWSASTDDDNDALTYELNVTLIGASTCTEVSRHISSLDAISHEIVDDLQCFYDNLDYYNWSVRASDSEEFSDWTSFFEVNISARIVISLPTNAVEFGDIAIEETNDTVDNSPAPFLLQNDGNAFVNITLNATDLWETQANPSQYFQYKVDNNSDENYSFAWDVSVTDFTNVYAVGSPTLCIAELNYTNATDTAEIDINITVPTDEGDGVRSSSITFTASLAE